jgi:putative ABC transport system permease protein
MYTCVGMDTVFQNLRHAIRRLRQSPTFAVVTILTLALAITANAVVFALVKAVLINPLPYGDPDRLVTIVEADRHTPNPQEVSAATFADLRRQSRSFEHLSLWTDASVRPIEAGLDMIRGMRVSTNFFDALGVPMYLGRSFGPDEDLPGRGEVLVLTYATWTERFGGDPRVVGRSIPAIGGAYTVVGVLPPDFYPLHMSNPAELPRMFRPLGDDVGRSTCRSSPCRAFRAVGRLKHGVTVAAVQAELNTIMRGLVRTYPADYPEDENVIVTPLRDHVVGQFGTALWMLEGARFCYWY